MLFESIENFSISEKIMVKMSNSLNIKDNSIILFLRQDVFDDDGLPVLVTTSLACM